MSQCASGGALLICISRSCQSRPTYTPGFELHLSACCANWGRGPGSAGESIYNVTWGGVMTYGQGLTRQQNPMACEFSLPSCAGRSKRIFPPNLRIRLFSTQPRTSTLSYDGVKHCCCRANSQSFRKRKCPNIFKQNNNAPLQLYVWVCSTSLLDLLNTPSK